MRLFTAVWPSQESTQHLSEALRMVCADSPEFGRAAERLRKFRWIPPQRWHLTLCFHGDDADPDLLGERLARRVVRLSRDVALSGGPWLRLAGAGVFRSVLWVGVEPATEADADTLRRLAGAAGADPRSYRAHMTVARWTSGRPEAGGLTEPLADLEGPWWQARELALVRSEQRSGEPAYRTLRRVAVPDGRGTPVGGDQE